MELKKEELRKKFKESLVNQNLKKLVGAHNAITSQLVEEAGFDGVWASGLEISASLGYPDANILTMNEVLNITKEMTASCNIPVIADCDNGFGGINNVIRTVKEYEKAGVAGICIEDKKFPKINSFVENDHTLVPIDDFNSKIIAAKETREDNNFILIARTEALISGLSIDDAVKRANSYLRAGADLVLIHSKKNDISEINKFFEKFDHPSKVVLVPTTYSNITYTELEELNINIVIHANQLLRSIIFNSRIFLNKLKNADSISEIESDISKVSDIFSFQNMEEFTEKEKEYIKLGKKTTENIMQF